MYANLKQVLRYGVNYIVSAGVDLVLYTAILFLLDGQLPKGSRIILAVCVARILSSLVNFTLNKQLFAQEDKQETQMALVRYYTLWFGLMVLAATTTYLLNDLLRCNEIISKILADSGLGILSYVSQKKWVFNTSINEAKKEEMKEVKIEEDRTEKKESKKGIYFRIVRGVARCFIKRELLIDDEVFNQEAVLIGHHQNFYGPISALAYMPDTVHLWAIDHLFSFKKCFDKYYYFTFRETIRLPRMIASVASLFCALTIPPLLKSAKAIPVYRGSKDILETFKISLELLDKGEQLLIFPDIDYDSQTSEVREVYTGFLNLDKKYYRQNRRHLPFVPVLFDRHTDNILGTPGIYFSEQDSYLKDKKRVEEKIIYQLNHCQ